LTAISAAARLLVEQLDQIEEALMTAGQLIGRADQ
jgi:hypothetical protein